MLGLNFVFTGRLEYYTQSKLKNLLRSVGSNVQEQLNKKTHYIIVGSKPSEKVLSKVKMFDCIKLSELELYLLEVKRWG